MSFIYIKPDELADKVLTMIHDSDHIKGHTCSKELWDMLVKLVEINENKNNK